MRKQECWNGRKVRIRCGEWKGKIGEISEIRHFNCTVVVTSVILKNKNNKSFFPSRSILYSEIEPFDKMFFNITYIELENGK